MLGPEDLLKAESMALKQVAGAADFKHPLVLMALLESHAAEKRSLTGQLAEEHSRRERAEAAERELLRALAFSNAALLEAHHRVKNTLQIAASVLSLQARSTSSSHVRTALLEGFGRLHLLSTVHELLYSSAAANNEIQMQSLLQAIGNALRRSFAEMSARVELRVTCDDIQLTPDIAVPMALLANEALTNAFKHAFPEESGGEISLALSREPEGGLILQVTDTGPGAGPGEGKSGLGMKLIRSFAEQVHGMLNVGARSNATGTTVTLRMALARTNAVQQSGTADAFAAIDQSDRPGSSRSLSALTTA